MLILTFTTQLLTLLFVLMILHRLFLSRWK